jgi:hypothetical protein
LEIFYFVGIISYGRILSPFKLSEHGLWVEDPYRNFTIDNQCLLSNECLLNGSSGGPLLLIGFQTKSVIDRGGNKWIFVEYVGVDFGGQFVRIKVEIILSLRSIPTHSFDFFILGAMHGMFID